MRIEELVNGKSDGDFVEVDGFSIPVAVLKQKMEDGYVHIKAFKENSTFSLWGENCTGCFSAEQLQAGN